MRRWTVARFVVCWLLWGGDDRAAVRCPGLPGLWLHRHEKGHAGPGDAGAAGAGRGSVQWRAVRLPRTPRQSAETDLARRHRPVHADQAVGARPFYLADDEYGLDRAVGRTIVNAARRV